jgi:metal-responsive CopG/Arc/MetJ family transcriptional regulator
MNFVTTNIRLPKEVLKKLKHKAVEDNKSVSQLIREAVQKFILGPHKEANHKKDSFNNVIGIAKSSPRDGSTRHDSYLYGKK